MIESKRKFEISHTQWIEMTAEQRKAHVEQILDVGDNAEVTDPTKLSVNFEKFNFANS